VRLAILSFVLFLSGSSALIFETLWLRLSGLAFGNSVWSAALILSSFMAGLALGTAIAASAKLQRMRPLYFYAALEVAVALLGCTIVFGLPLIGEWMRPVFQALWTHQVVLMGLRLVLSFAILLVPTTAMGLTLPVVLEDPALARHDFGRAIGLLYGWNTLGAVIGALLGEMFLVEALGLWGTSLVAGSVNCVAAALAVLLARAIGPTPAISPAPAPRLRLEISYRPPWRLLFVSLGAGALLLGLEVVWFRFLRLYVASSSTAFAMMLAVVLAGIGLGGVVSGTILRRVTQLREWLPIFLMLAAIAALLSYLFFPIPALPSGILNYYLESWQKIALLSLALMFPVAFLSGMLFPSIVALVQNSVESRMNSVGITTLFNTSGAAAGPLVASFVLLPSIGFERTLILCASGYALLAVAMSGRESWSAKRPHGAAMLGLGTAFILLVMFFPYHRDEAHFANARRLFESENQHLIKKVEGSSDTWQLLRRDLFGEPYYYRLMTNAFSMSATNPRNQRYMRLFAYLPLTLRPEPEDALLICYGVGVTADALACDRHLKRIDIVDISREVFSLTDYYSDLDHPNPLHDPRVTTYVQDGRFFLQASPRQYDLITGEPPPPKVAGAVNLYTQEFFMSMCARLKEGGIATFWLPIYQLQVNETEAILRAFHNAFPNASLWASSDEEWIMMGMKGPARRLSEEDVRRLWNETTTRADLARVGIEVPEQMAALFLMDGEEIDRITQGIEPLTDFYPKRLSDPLPDPHAADQFAWTYMEGAPALRRFQSSALAQTIWPNARQSSLESFFLLRETRYLSGNAGSNWRAELDLYLRGSRLRVPVLEVLGSDEFRLSLAEKVAAKSPPPLSEIVPDLVAGALARRDFGGAIRLLEMEKDRHIAEPRDIYLLTYLYCLNGNVEKAEELAASDAGSKKKGPFVDWLWDKLRAEFGFRPPQ
jgi:spermidine synthase